MQATRGFHRVSSRLPLHRSLSTLSLSPSPMPSQCYRVLLLGARDTAVSQAIRLRLAHDDGVRVSLEFASSSSGLSAAIGAHKPHMIVCMDAHAASLLPEPVLLDKRTPCLTFVTSSASDMLHAIDVQSSLDKDTQSMIGKPLMSVDVPQPLGVSRSQWMKSAVNPAVTNCVVDAVRKSRHGMQLSSSDCVITGTLFRHDDPSLHDMLGDVDFGLPADKVAARITAADSAPGTRWTVQGQDVLLYGAHVDTSSFSQRPHGQPGSVVGQRHGAVAIQCGSGVVWVSHMKSMSADCGIKLPSTSVLPHSILRTAPVLPDPPLVLPHSQHKPTTFQDVWATVDANVATLHFPLYNGVVTLDQSHRLRDAFNALTKRDDVAVILLAGGGSLAFHNGMDFNTIHGSVNPFGTAWSTMNAMNDFVRDLLTCSSKVVISAIGGSASAGGLMSSLASDLVWTHGDVVLNPHYKAMGLHGSDYWTYTLPKRVGVHTARDITNGIQPMSARDALSAGIVDSILAQSVGEFASVAAVEARKLAGDEYLLRAMLDRKQANVRPESLEAMHRARLYESVVMRDNLRDAGHVALRKQLVEKIVPLSTPLYISGQSGTFGRVLDGKQLAQLKLRHMKQQVAGFKDTMQMVPTLGLLLVGDRPDSRKYVQHKIKACKDVGIDSVVETVPLDDSAPSEGDGLTAALIRRVREMNANPGIHGIIVQLPLPPSVDTTRVLAEISPSKDVDGFGADHLGVIAGGVSRFGVDNNAKPFVPCTAAGIMELLNHYSISVSGKQVVIVGRSAIVGMPSQLLFMKRHATVNACDIHTPDLQSKVSQADIVIVAAGSAHLVKGHWIKPGAVVVDVGINFDKSGKMCGDVEFDVAVKNAAYITPVPGGVGPMTVAMLLENTVQAFQQQTRGVC